MITRRRQHRTGPSGTEAPDDGLPHTTLVIRSAQASPMTGHLASTQQRRAKAGPLRRRMPVPRLLDGTGAKTTTDGSGRTLDWTAPASVVVNETKLAIVAVMQDLDRPVSSTELQRIRAEHKALEIFEYHLSTLVKAKVAEVVYGPELHFRLTVRSEGPESLL
jgi:hypothetical protein